VNYARRQEHRRLAKATAGAAAAAAAGLLALAAASAGALSFAGVLTVAAVALGLYTRHWVRLARRSRIGARSEDDVRRALAPLQAKGWRVRHSLPWQGQGDIDSLVIGPTGVAVVIETKTRAYDHRHLARVREQAAWLYRYRRRWCRNGVLPMLCLVRARRMQCVQDDVLVVSLDRLMPALRDATEVVRPRRDH
jgi:hypothetical protein